MVEELTLKSISFPASPGDLVALVGPSGAGKSTISALVPRLYDATSGSVKLGGLDVRDVTQESLHKVVGVVMQDAHMYHDTILANLLYANVEADESEIWSAC
jgi:ATP-binding cassette subfamily B protein